ncbi:MAG TPA: response regulator, partial [Parvularculaceae bacterium]|nr:response regulator [Parvularculaceae bacterium]
MTTETEDEHEGLRAEPEGASLLIVDDDEPFRVRLGRAMEKRGFAPVLAAGARDAIRLARETPPDYAVVDLRLEDGDGLEVVNAIHELREDCRVIMLTGYGNIATAVAAVKA